MSNSDDEILNIDAEVHVSNTPVIVEGIENSSGQSSVVSGKRKSSEEHVNSHDVSNADLFSLFTSYLNKVASFLPYGSRIYSSLLTGAGISSAITFRIVKLLYDNDISDKFGFIGTSILHLIIGGLSTVLHKVFDKLHNGEVVIELEVPELSKSNGTLDSHSELICNIAMESHLTLKHSVCRFVTITHLMWYSILLTMMYMYIGTINQRLEENVLPDQVSHFTNMMAYITLSGTITSLIPGGVAELQQKMYTGATNRKETEIIQHILPLTITSGLAIVLSSLSFSAAPSTFYVEFVVLTIFTSFLFASNMTFIASVYPMKHNQFIFALSASVGGIISSIQYGLFRWYNMYDGAHLHVRICMIILAILTLVHPVSVLCSAKDFSKDKTCCKGKRHTIYVSKTETTKM